MSADDRIAQYLHTATLLPSGKVLILCGLSITPAIFSFFLSGEGITSVTNYDPATNAVTNTAPSLLKGANTIGLHTATLLATGMVLTTKETAAELLDPASGTFTPTGTPKRPCVFGSASVPLQNGKVLIVGGYAFNPLGSIANAEVYDPSTGEFSLSGSMINPRHMASATLLSDGRVLIFGGANGVHACETAEIYTPSTGTFASIVAGSRVLHTATVLGNGKVLITGGGSSHALNTAELFNPSTNTFTPTGAMNTPRRFHAANLLLDGRVLITGGFADSLSYPLDSCEIYNPATGIFTTTTPLQCKRQGHTATTLANGKVLVFGGCLDWKIDPEKPLIRFFELWEN